MTGKEFMERPPRYLTVRVRTGDKTLTTLVPRSCTAPSNRSADYPVCLGRSSSLPSQIRLRVSPGRATCSVQVRDC